MGEWINEIRDPEFTGHSSFQKDPTSENVRKNDIVMGTWCIIVVEQAYIH